MLSDSLSLMSAGHATFPVFHHTDPSVAAGVVDEDPVPAHAVRGVRSESLLHCHAAVLALNKS